MPLLAIALAILFAGPGCYLSHEAEGTPPARPTDATVDGPPDAGPPECEGEEWTRIDLGAFPGTRIGPVAASETTIAWMGRNLAGVALTRLDRRTLELSETPIDPAYVQDGSVHFTGEGFVVAYEHTGPMGMNEGVWVTFAEDGIDGSIAAPVRLSDTGGDPDVSQLLPDRVLVAWNDRGAVVNELSLTPLTPLGRSRRLDEEVHPGVAAAATPTEYLVGSGSTIVALDPETLRPRPFWSSPEGDVLRRLVHNDLHVSAEHRGGVLEYFTFDGESVALIRPVTSYDIPIAGYRQWLFGINPQTAEAKVTAREVPIPFDAGAFDADFATVNHTPTGFVALTASLPVGNAPLVTLIEHCGVL